MSEAVNKVIRGLEDAEEYTRVNFAVHNWLRDDAPLAAKMNLLPSHVAKLVDRIVGSKTHNAR